MRLHVLSTVFVVVAQLKKLTQRAGKAALLKFCIHARFSAGLRVYRSDKKMKSFVNVFLFFFILSSIVNCLKPI